MAENKTAESEWVRPPRRGEKLYSLSGPTVYRLVKDGKVRVRRLVRPGAKKGCTFINLTDIKALIESAPSVTAPALAS
jgi:hypothetical protein